MTPLARLLALIALGMLVASGTAFAQTTVDYDMDNDGYIDITNLDQLNAIRWDLNADGAPDSRITSADSTAYNAAFPNRIATATSSVGRMGCPTSGCVGYELMNDLDFDSDGDGDVDARDYGGKYWNNGLGWAPIYSGGLSADAFTGETYAYHTPIPRTSN